MTEEEKQKGAEERWDSVGYRQDSCANLILDKPPGYQIPGQAVAVKVAVHLS